MLRTDEFVFLHLPRAGGTFVYDVGYKTIREVKTDFARS
jgi:hypothetical protein